jgi:zinc protease
MNKNLLSAFLIIVSLTQTILAQNIPDSYKKIKELGGIEEYLLESNGLNVLLLEDHSAPVLTFMVTYKVGSRNEVIGTTGATHILEHLMFKGTPTFNKRKGTQIAATLQNMGALMNATTWLDRTNYYENIPSDKLELAVHIESDRMRNSLLREEDRNSEMTVVRNEFEQGENNPIELLDKELWANSYLAHPYHHSTIGWRSDIENVPIEKLREFYNTFYWPNNATVTVIGDFEKSNTLVLIKKYFGAISSSPHEIPKVYTEEPEQYGPRRVIVRKAGQLGVVGIAYKSPPGLHGDTYSFQVLANKEFYLEMRKKYKGG